MAISSMDELERSNISARLLLLHGDIAREQLMPKNFVFYNPVEHQRIISLLEKGRAKSDHLRHREEPFAGRGCLPIPLD